MKLCLVNLTDNAILLKSHCCRNYSEQIFLPGTSATIPSGKQKFVMSSVQSNLEKVLLDSEIERRYVIALTKSSYSRRSLLTMPEDCPWHIYRDQVTSPAPYYSSVE
jgi:hypothetical protein